MYSTIFNFKFNLQEILFSSNYLTLFNSSQVKEIIRAKEKFQERNKRIYSLAEYHHSHSGYNGFFISEMKKMLSAEDFSNIEILLFRTKGKIVEQVRDSLHKRLYYTHFCFFAQKKS